MLWFITLCVLAYAAFYQRAKAYFTRGKGRVVRWVVRSIVLIMALVIAMLAVYAHTEPPAGQERLLVVLGAPLVHDQPCQILLANGSLLYNDNCVTVIFYYCFISTMFCRSPREARRKVEGNALVGQPSPQQAGRHDAARRPSRCPQSSRRG